MKNAECTPESQRGEALPKITAQLVAEQRCDRRWSVFFNPYYTNATKDLPQKVFAVAVNRIGPGESANGSEGQLVAL
jgi:hypothetical protein